MKKLELLLLEDNELEAKKIEQLLTEEYNIVSVSSKTAAEKTIKEKYFDIIILDIMIDGKPDGILFAKNLKTQNINVPFIFLTSVQSKSVFESAKYTQPLSYLIKPFNKLELLYTLELAIEKHYGQSQTLSVANDNAIISPNHIFVRKNDKILKLKVDNINYVKVEDKYCSLNCEKGNFLIKMSLVKLKDILSASNFRQVHRNYLINMNSIEEIYLKDNLIILNNKAKVPFSERHKSLFIKNERIFG